jgi:peptide/nickel transport system substrate-binding protein
MRTTLPGVRGARSWIWVLMILPLIACSSPATPSAGQTGNQPSSNQAPPARTGPARVTIAIGAEVNNLATKFEGGNTFSSEFHFMGNSPLVVREPQGTARALLAAELPSRDNGTWVVNADGTMRTTWKIRPNAKWHDGQPVVARDFVFAYRVYTDEALAVREREPERFMERVEAVDDKTFVVHWKQPYPWAGELVSRQLEPLPTHLAQSLYESLDPEAFLGNGLWTTTAYVGTGPFRLVQWDQGSQLIYRAFDDYFMGKPKLDEVIFRIIADSNTVVANVLSGAVDTTVGITLPQQAAVTIKRQWPANEGEVIASPTRWRYQQIQFDPARLQQPALLDQRVRRAIVHSLDRATIAEVVTEGTSKVADTPVVPTDALYPRVQERITQYPYDQTRALALMQEAGWTRQGDRLVNANGQPFNLELRTTAQTDNETEQSLVAADLAKLGLVPQQVIVPQSRIRDSEYRVTFPGLNGTAQSIDLPGILSVAISDQCASAERRFVGSNRGCWKNPQFDRFYEIGTTSLDRNERDNAVVDAFRVMTDEVGIFGLSYNAESLAVRKGLVGPGTRYPGQVGNTWNVHEWHWS